MEGEPNAPWIHSVSYGDKESSISKEYTERCDIEFQKFGTTGRTIFFASGDDGVGCGPNSCGPGGNPLLEPNWPSSSPYVTSVVSICCCCCFICTFFIYIQENREELLYNQMENLKVIKFLLVDSLITLPNHHGNLLLLLLT